MTLHDLEVKRLVHEFSVGWSNKMVELEDEQLQTFGGYLKDFIEDLLNYPLVRPWRESLDLFQEHYWEQAGMRLAGESYVDCAARIERAINDPRCPAHGPIRPGAAATRPRPTPDWLVGPAKPRPPGGIPPEQEHDLRRLARRVAAQEQKRIALSDEETALYESYRYENFRRQHTGDRPLEQPDFWITKNAAVTRRQRGTAWPPVAHQTAEPTKAAAGDSNQNEPRAAVPTPSGQPPKHRQADAGEQFFSDKVAEAQHCLDEMRRLLDALGQKLDAAKIDEEVDVDADVDEIEDLIWRYNDALESARDAWLRDNLSGALNTRLLEMSNPSSLGLPLFTDDDQAQRAWRQATQIGERLRAHDATMDRVIVGMRATEIAGDAAGFAIGVGVVAKAVKTGGKWAVVKTVVAISAGIATEQGVEKGLRAAGAGEQTIRGARLAAAVVTLILLRRRSGSGGIAAAAEPPKPPGRGIWGLTPEARWTAVEQRLGKNLPGNFRTIDKFEGGIATSIKSLDLGAKSYANPSTLTRVVQGYVDKVAAYKGGKWNRTIIDADKIKGRTLDLAVPPDGTQEQRSVLQSLIEYGKQHGVVVNIVEMW